MWIIETINIDMFIFAVSYDYFVFVHVDASGSAKISLRPDNEDSKRIKTKRKPKTKRRSKLVVSDSDDIALQLNMINVFQKTSKYRNEPHRCLCMPPSLRNQTPQRTSTTESSRRKPSASFCSCEYQCIAFSPQDQYDERNHRRITRCRQCAAGWKKIQSVGSLHRSIYRGVEGNESQMRQHS